MRKFGLIGKNISYSFSEKYFTDKFKKLKLSTHKYSTYDLNKISEIEKLLLSTPNITGLNVTIPYKESIMKYLDGVSDVAREIQAVNTIKISKGKLLGYNTDVYGFEKSIKPFFEPQHRRALILGTGGAAKAVAYVLKKLDVDFFYVSRNPKGEDQVSYIDLTKEAISKYYFIINCSPVGTYPNVDECPSIPYDGITAKHLLYDLVYNPQETLFLKKGKNNGATIVNGLSMLHHQAEEAWRIWNE